MIARCLFLLMVVLPFVTRWPASVPDLTYGRLAVGFRTQAVPAASGRAGGVHVWYPAAACSTPLTYGDYLARLGIGSGDLASELRRALEADAGAIPADGWARVVGTPMRGCSDAQPSGQSFPLILGIHLPGSWPVTAELLASHGYVVAFVARVPTLPMAREMTPRIARRLTDFVEDLEVAESMMAATGLVRPGEVGAIGQSHALLMYAMRRPVRAVSLQDSGFQEGPEAAAAMATGLWKPADFRAPLLHVLPAARLSEEVRWPAFIRESPASWTRVAFTAASTGHADVTSDGYLMRTRVPLPDARHAALVRVFERVTAAHVAFFDRHLARKPDAPLLRRLLDPASFTLEER